MPAKRSGNDGEGKTGGKHDDYPTPEWVVNALFRRLALSPVATAIEPCRGTPTRPIFDRMVRERLLTDWCEIREGRDYLASTYAPQRCDLGITNPPFRWAEPIARRMLVQCRTVCLLLPLGFFGAKKRKAFWEGAQPTHLITLSTRPSFTGKGTDAETYAWVCWDRLGIVDGPRFQWVERLKAER